MKKLLVVILGALMVLSGCQGTGNVNDGDVIELTFWAHQNEAWNNSYRDIIAAFEAENEGIRIKLESFPYDDFQSKVQTSLINKTGGADIYELWGGWAIDFAHTGALAMVPAELEGDLRDDVYAPTIGALEYDGHLYGLPLEFNIEIGGMLVNLNLLNEKGLSVPTTWEALRETGQAGSVIDNNIFSVKGFDFVNWDSVPYLFATMILSSGSNYLNDDGTFNVTSEEAKTAFAELVSLIKDYNVTNLDGLTGGSDLEGYQLLFANRAMMVPRGPWVISEGIESFQLTLGEDFDYVGLPWFGSEKKFAAETGWSLAVNGSSTEQEAAFKFIEYLYQDDVLLAHNIRAQQIPPKKSVKNDASFREAMPHLEVLIDILEGGQFIGHFNTDQFKETINNTFVDYNMGQYSSIDAALEDMNAKLNAILD